MEAMSTLEARRRNVRSTAGDITLRPPRPGDAARIHALVAACPPLDLNSVYAYLLVGAHFAGTSVVAARDATDAAIAGFVSGYLKPGEPSTLFIWQVAVAADARGLGLGRRLLDAVLARPGCRDVRHLETTITPSNEPSWRLFASLARERGAPAARSPLFDTRAFGDTPHEEETLLRIGPLPGPHGGS